MPKTCFIVGPIGSAGSPVRQLADWLMHGVIKPVLETEEMGYVVKRADEDASPGSINHAVMTDVINSDLVIADLTGFNPNAFYELGIRHAVQKPTIHMIAEAVNLPFDNNDQRTIFVNLADYGSYQAAKVRLKAAVEATHQQGYQVVNPYTQAGALNVLRGSEDPKDQIIAGLEERLSRLEDRQDPARVHRPWRNAVAQALVDAKASRNDTQHRNAAFAAMSAADRLGRINDILSQTRLTSSIDAMLLEQAKDLGMLDAVEAERAQALLEEWLINTVEPRNHWPNA